MWLRTLIGRYRCMSNKQSNQIAQNAVTVALTHFYWLLKQEIDGPPCFFQPNGSAARGRSAKHDQLPLSRLVFRHFRQILTKISQLSSHRTFVGQRHSSGVDMSADEEVIFRFFIQSQCRRAWASSKRASSPKSRVAVDNVFDYKILPPSVETHEQDFENNVVFSFFRKMLSQ